MLIRPTNTKADYAISEDGITWVNKSLSSTIRSSNYGLYYGNGTYVFPGKSDYYFYTDNLNNTPEYHRLKVGLNYSIGSVVYIFENWFFTYLSSSGSFGIRKKSDLSKDFGTTILSSSNNSAGIITSNNLNTIVCSDYSDLYYSKDGTNFFTTTNPLGTCSALAYSEVQI